MFALTCSFAKCSTATSLRLHHQAKLKKSSYLLRSQMFIPIEKANPAGAKVESHKLLLKTGLARQTASGLYTLLPLGLRVIEKICALVDDEMASVGGQKLSLPLLLPADAWKRTGRWEAAGHEMLALKDRRGEDYCLAPTHEEAITELLAREGVLSYRRLPLRLYQIGPKFRDEKRPRHGLMRAREFIMKDMYSFDATVADAHRSYEQLHAAYHRIFQRLELPYLAAEADSGNIGGSRSAEFHTITAAGEDSLLHCSACRYTANVEKARSRLLSSPTEKTVALRRFSSVAELSGSVLDGSAGLRGWLVHQKGTGLVALALVRSDRELNELALKSAPLPDPMHVHTTPLTQQSAFELTGTLPKHFRLLLDHSVLQTAHGDEAMRNALGVLSRLIAWGDYRVAAEHDGCPECAGTLQTKPGMEMGHVFYLGTKYSAVLNASVQGAQSSSAPQPVEMGCYGIGITRVLAALLETKHDAEGIKWPHVVAPYRAVLVAIGEAGAAVHGDTAALAAELSELPSLRGELVLDERPADQATAGLKMREARLLGFPFMAVLGREFAARGLIELHKRSESKPQLVTREQLREVLLAQS